jgi:amino acid transporter
MFVLGTSSIVALVPRDKVDLISPISQALTLGTRQSDPGASLIPRVLAALFLSFVGQLAISFGITTRLPLVAGWDNLLPAWFSRLHPGAKRPPTRSFSWGRWPSPWRLPALQAPGNKRHFSCC